MRNGQTPSEWSWQGSLAAWISDTPQNRRNCFDGTLPLVNEQLNKLTTFLNVFKQQNFCRFRLWENSFYTQHLAEQQHMSLAAWQDLTGDFSCAGPTTR